MDSPRRIDIPALNALAENAWSTVINLPIQPSNDEMVDPFIKACIQITIDPQIYVVVLSTGKQLAFEIAAGMLGLTSEEVSDQDRDDALGEVINILAGGVKSMIPEASTLSIPMVVAGADISMVFPRGCQLLLSANFISADKQLSLSLYHQE